jgi:hypothetical protein
MRSGLAVAVVVLAANAAIAKAAQVDCNRGNSVNDALTRLAARAVAAPTTLWVTGTCTEYVQIRGFDGLALKGRPGATLVKPSTPADPLVGSGVLTIDASRSVTVDGLALQGGGIGIRGGSSDIRVRNTTVEGGGIGIYEHSQVSLAGVEVRNPSFAALQVYDLSDVHLEDSVFENTAGGYRWGVFVTKALLTMHGTVIQGFATGLNVFPGGVLDVADFDSFVPAGGATEVLIESPTSVGCAVSGGTVMLSGAKLHITNAGVNGVYVSQGGRVTGNYLEVTGSGNQGVLVTHNSAVSLGGATITGNVHGGLVVVNQSTAEAGGATLSGNGSDLFCDSRSLVTGGGNIKGEPTIQCSNLLSGSYEALP